MKKYFFCLVTIVFLYVLYSHGVVAQDNIIQKDIQTSAFFGTGGPYSFLIFGYTSPGAMVRLDGVGPYDITYAEKNGYFEFRHSIGLNEASKEPCLQAQDQLGRTSSPICLPPIVLDTQVRVGPIILPPTISLNNDSYVVGDQVILSGQTLPNSNLNLSVFTAQLPSLLSHISLVKQVEAFSIPKMNVTSDQDGNFAAVLPSSQSQQFNIFTQVAYEDGFSGKSNTLHFLVYPFWIMLLRFFASILGLLKPYLVEIGIVVQTIVLIVLFLHRKRRSHAIVLVKQYSLTVYQPILPQK